MLQKVDLTLERMKYKLTDQHQKMPIFSHFPDAKIRGWACILQSQLHQSTDIIITLPPALSAKGPSTLHTTIQKMQLSYIHATNFVNSCNNSIYAQRFSQQVSQKTLCSFERCVECKGLKPQCYMYSENNCLTVYRTQYTNSLVLYLFQSFDNTRAR